MLVFQMFFEMGLLDSGITSCCGRYLYQDEIENRYNIDIADLRTFRFWNFVWAATKQADR